MLSAGLVSALEVEYPVIFGMSIGPGSSFAEYAKYFFNIGVFLAVFISAIILAFGGIYFLIDYSKGKMAGEGKEWIKSGAIGMFLTVCAYLIAFTINPYLVIFDLKNLGPLTYIANILNINKDNPLPIDIYTEIPIGTLTENLVAGTMSCYEFDSFGDPIDGEVIKIDSGERIPSPTFLEHDRVDCIFQLAKAADKKAELVDNLSQKIIDMMEQCSCSLNMPAEDESASNDFYFAAKTSAYGYCTNNCGEDSCGYSGSCDSSTAANNGRTDICSDNCQSNGCNCSHNSCDQCPEGYKKKIDEGPICLTYFCGDVDSSTTDNSECNKYEKDFKGMKEFRSDYNWSYEAIKQVVEVEKILNNKKIFIFNDGGCSPCDIDCPSNNDICQRELLKCRNNRKKCMLQKSPWYKLKLVDQLVYLQGKLEEIKKEVEEDYENLTLAEDELGNCYLADSYVDFLKTYEQTDKTKKTILIEQTYSEQGETEMVNPAKYCKGFQYNNSECYSQCQKLCPGDQQKDFDCYKSGDIEDCFNKRSCTPGISNFSTFKECLSTCREKCEDSCEILCDETDKENCKEKCKNDSKCVVDNADSCLMDFSKLGKDCSESKNLEEFQQCLESATLCTYCSDQYAGYADCQKPNYYFGNEYSSSYLYKHPESQLCQKPNKSVGATSSGEQIPCITAYPETTKCSSSSKCPDCPCDITNKNSEYIFPQDYSTCSGDDFECRVCSGSCDEFYFNDDSLTFYCNQSWWTKDDAKKTVPIGEERICLKSREVPVGQVVDESEQWGAILAANIKSISESVNNLVNYLRKIGEEKNYCLCSSKCNESGKESACEAECAFVETQTINTDEEGSETITYNCSCERQSCAGNPCQKIINLLKGKAANEKCPKGVEYKGVKYYHSGISFAIKNFYTFTIEGGRSDIVKKLDYARKSTGDCSTTQNNYGENYVRLLSCTRVEDEIVSPITDKGKNIFAGETTPFYCYGKELGKVRGYESPLMDNWFCCETRKQELQ